MRVRGFANKEPSGEGLGGQANCNLPKKEVIWMSLKEDLKTLGKLNCSARKGARKARAREAQEREAGMFSDGREAARHAREAEEYDDLGRLIRRGARRRLERGE